MYCLNNPLFYINLQMPEIAIQTDEIIENPPENEPKGFKVLTKEEEKKLTGREFKAYRRELRAYKRENARKKYNEYMAVYMKNYRKMKYKYDPVFREKVKYNRRLYYYKEKAIQKEIITKEQYNELEEPEKLISQLMINNQI